jgi:hypothetical protein
VAESEHTVSMRIEVKTFGAEDKVVMNAISTITRILIRVFSDRVNIWYQDADLHEIPVKYDPSLKVSSMRLVRGARVVSVGDR